MKWSRLAAIVVAALLAGGGLAGCGSAAAPAPQTATRTSAGATSGPSTRPPSDPPPRATPAIHHTGPPTALPVAPGAGAEPQTRTLPSTDSVAFRHAMTDLWLAVTTGNSRLGLPAFFPLGAYQQLKAPPRTGTNGCGMTSPSMSAQPTAWWAPARGWSG
jgi:hypothetical protein